MFLGLPDQHPDFLVTSTDRGLDPDPSIIKQKYKEKLWFLHCIVTSLRLFTSVPDPLDRALVPRIRILIRTNMSRIHNTGKNRSKWFGCLRIIFRTFMNCFIGGHSHLLHSIAIFIGTGTFYFRQGSFIQKVSAWNCCVPDPEVFGTDPDSNLAPDPTPEQHLAEKKLVTKSWRQQAIMELGSGNTKWCWS